MVHPRWIIHMGSTSLCFHHLDFFIELLKCPHNMAASFTLFLLPRKEQGRSHNGFYKQTSEVTWSTLFNVERNYTKVWTQEVTIIWKHLGGWPPQGKRKSK